MNHPFGKMGNGCGKMAAKRMNDTVQTGGAQPVEKTGFGRADAEVDESA